MYSGVWAIEGANKIRVYRLDSRKQFGERLEQNKTKQKEKYIIFTKIMVTYVFIYPRRW